MTPKLIGLTGYKRSGKDTAADYLVKKHGYIRYAFGDPLKQACASIFSLSHDQVDGDLKETPDPRWNNMTPRHMFQIFGTEIVRMNFEKYYHSLTPILKNENLWLYRFRIWYSELLKTNPNAKVVVSDVRFPDEAAIVKEFGGTVIMIERPCKIQSQLLDQHASEASIANIEPDKRIINNKTIRSLHGKIRRFA